MAVTSFTINGTPASFQNTPESFYDVLNGGNIVDNILEYNITLSGLTGHVINSITIQSLLFNSDYSFGESANYKLELKKNSTLLSSYSGTIVSNVSSKTPFGVKFTTTSSEAESASTKLTLTVSSTVKDPSYYGLYKIIVELKDVLEEIHYTFSGPLTYRSPSSIIINSVSVVKGVQAVTFSRDPIKKFDSALDTVDGKIYFRQDGIFIDGYQFGVNAIASETTKGAVKLQNKFELDENGNIIIPNDVGVAASPQLVMDLQTNFPLATKENKGVVTLLDNFDISEDEGIICPEDKGIAASAQLVFNTLATVKNYVDEQTDFSDDFIQKDDKKLYIRWITIDENGGINTY